MAATMQFQNVWPAGHLAVDVSECVVRREGYPADRVKDVGRWDAARGVSFRLQ